MAGVKIKVSTEEAQTAVKKLRQDLSQLGMTTEEVDADVKKLESRLMKQLGADKAKASIDSLQRSLGLTKSEVKKLEKEFGTAESAFSKFGKTIKSVGGQLGITFSALAAIGIGKKMYNMAAEYESALIDMRKVTDESYESIRKTIASIGPEFGTQTQLMKGYYSIMSAGIKDPIAAMDLLKTASSTALSQNMEQQEVVKALTALMFGYGEAIKSAADASDLLFAIDAAGKTSVAELVPVIGDLASISNQAGLNVDEMGAAMAVLSQTAGSTSQAATQLQSILVGLIRPQEKMRDLLKSAGYESGKAMVEMLGFSGALMKVKEEAAKANEPIGRYFRSSEAIIGLGPMLSTNMKEFEDRLVEIANKTGLSDSAFKEYQTTAKSVGEVFQNTISGIMKDLGETILPSVVEALKQTSIWLKENKDAFKYFADSVMATYNGLPDGVVTGAAVGIIGMMLFGGPAGVIAGGLTLINAQLSNFNLGITQLPEKVRLVRKDLDDMWEEIKKLFSGDELGSDIAGETSGIQWGKNIDMGRNIDKWISDLKKWNGEVAEMTKTAKGYKIPVDKETTQQELESMYDKAKSLTENYYKELGLKVKENEISMKAAGKSEEEINAATYVQKYLNINSYYEKEKALIKLEAEARSSEDKEKLSSAQFIADKMDALESDVALKKKTLFNENLADEQKFSETKLANAKKISEAAGEAAAKEYKQWEENQEKKFDQMEEDQAKYELMVAEEADFAATENERAINKIIADQKKKMLELNKLQEGGNLTYQQYLDQKKKINATTDAAILERERTNAKNIADLNYELIQDIKGYAKEAYDARIKQIDADAAAKLAEGANWKYIEEWKKKETIDAYIKMGKAGEDFFDGVKAGAADMIKSFKSVGTLGFEFMQSSFTALSDTIGSVFGDLLKGELKSFSDYWQSFCDSLLAAFAKMIAQLIAQWLIFESTVALFGESFASSLGLKGVSLSGLFGGSSGGGLLGAIGSFIFNKILGSAASWVGDVTGLSGVFDGIVSWGKELIGVGKETVSSLGYVSEVGRDAYLSIAELDAATSATTTSTTAAGSALTQFTMSAELAKDSVGTATLSTTGWGGGAIGSGGVTSAYGAGVVGGAYAILAASIITLAVKFGEELWDRWTNNPGFGSTGQWEGAWSGKWGEVPSEQDSAWTQLVGSAEAASSDVRDYLVNVIKSVYSMTESISDSLDPAFVEQLDAALSEKTVTFIKAIGGAVTPSGTVDYTRETEKGLTEWIASVQTNMIDTYTGTLKDMLGTVQTTSVDTTEFETMVNTTSGDIMGGIEEFITRITDGVETEFMGMYGGLGDIGITASDITTPINDLLGIVVETSDTIANVVEEVDYVSWDVANKIGDTLQSVAVSVEEATEDASANIFGQIEDSINAGWADVTVAVTTQTNKWVPYLEEELRDLYPELDDRAIDDLMNLQRALENIDSKSSVQALEDIQFALNFNDTLDDIRNGVDEVAGTAGNFDETVKYYMKSINEELIEGEQDAQESAEAMMDALRPVYDYYIDRTKELGLSVEDMNEALGDWVITMMLGEDAVDEFDKAAAEMIAYWSEMGDQLVEWGYSVSAATEIAAKGLVAGFQAVLDGYTDTWEEDYLKLTMTEDEYLAHQLEQAEALKQKIYEATDPSEIISLGEEYAEMMNDIWSSMTDDQKTAMYTEFKDAMDAVGVYFEDQMADGADKWKSVVDGTSNSYDASTATFQEAVAYFASAVESFAGSSSSYDDYYVGPGGASGGWVGGGIKGQDSVRALLMPNEFVVPADVAPKHSSALESIRSSSRYVKMAAGGFVGMADGGFVGTANPDYSRTYSSSSSSQTLADEIAEERANYRLTLMELEWNSYMDLAEEAYTHEMNLLKLAGVSETEISLKTLDYKEALYDEDYEKQKEMIELAAELRSDDEREVLSDAEYVSRKLVKLDKERTLAFKQFANERELINKTEIADRKELLKQMEIEKKELEIANNLEKAKMEIETRKQEMMPSDASEAKKKRYELLAGVAKYRAEYEASVKSLKLEMANRTEDERRILSDEEWYAHQMDLLNAEKDMKLYELMQNLRRARDEYGENFADPNNWKWLFDFNFDDIFQYASSGGWVHGGIPGKDSVPTMLTPNEFVVPEKPAKEYAALLELIRSGRIYGAKDGIDFVPYDGFPVVLHRGEAVLTDDENEDRRTDSNKSKKGGVNVTFNLTGTVIDRRSVDDFAKTIYPKLDKLRRLGY